MALPRRPAPTTPIDLEETAELPVLDMAAVSGVTVPPAVTDDPLAITDVYSSSGVLPIGVAEMAENLRDVEDRLHRRSERLAALERELDAAHTSERNLRESLDHSVAEARAAAERAGFEAQQLAEKNRIASARLEQLETMLQERDAALTERARELDARAEQLADLNAAVTQTKAHELALAGERDALVSRAGDIDQQLAQRTADLAGERNSHATTAANLRDREALCQRLELQFNESVTRNERQIEALRDAEGCRSITDVLIAEREDEIRALELKLREFDAQGAAERAQIVQRDQQIAELGQAAERDVQKLAEQAARIAALIADLAARDKRNAELERAQTAAERNAEARSEALRVASDHSAEINSLLSAERIRTAALTTDLATAHAQLARHDRAVQEEAERLKASRSQHAEATARAAALDVQLAAEKARATSLDTELEELRARMASEQQAAEALAAGFAAREDEFAGGAEREKAFADLLDDQQEVINTLKSEVLAAGQRATQLEEDLRVAEVQINRVEADLRHRDARVEELSHSGESLQARLAEAERGLAERDAQVKRMESEAHANAAVLGNIQQSIQRLGRDDTDARPAVMDAPLDSLARLFVRQDGGSEVVHVLSRRTTIGRTSDNDIPIDTSFVSRHHAVVLASPKHTIVEDLNSTNGVLVNGRRITRQLLHDGDKVQVGKTEFLYQLKPLGNTGAPA